MSATLWITGVAGFSGRHLAAHIASRRRRPAVVGLDVCEAPAVPLDSYERIDLCDAAAVAALARQRPPDWVVHLAGVAPDVPPGDLWKAHVGATLGLADGLARAGCHSTRLLGIGSAAEYAPAAGALDEASVPGPASEYGRSKLAQTLLTVGFRRTLGLRACVARTFNLVGPGLPGRFVVGHLCSEFARVDSHGAITIRHLDSSRDFVDVRDAVDAYWRLVRRCPSGEIFNVCSGAPVSLHEVVAHLSAVTGRHPAIRTTARLDESGGRDVVFGTYAKLQALTRWSPQIDLPSSIRAMLADSAAVPAHPADDAR